MLVSGWAKKIYGYRSALTTIYCTLTCFGLGCSLIVPNNSEIMDHKVLSEKYCRKAYILGASTPITTAFSLISSIPPQLSKSGHSGYSIGQSIHTVPPFHGLNTITHTLATACLREQGISMQSICRRVPVCLTYPDLMSVRLIESHDLITYS